MTNADCIRHMSDEQLYEFLSEWECGDIDYAVTFCDLCNEATKRGEVGNVLNLDCDGCRKHWLQRDAVEYGGLMYWKRNTVFDTADRKTEQMGDARPIPLSNRVTHIKDEPQTESLEQFRVGLEYHTDTTHFGKAKGESVTTNKVEDGPQTDDPCDGCVCDDGKHLMYCMNCKGIAWKTEPPQTEEWYTYQDEQEYNDRWQTDCPWR